ncbi:MAG TPA: hypothetical protein VIY86_08695, partial [Pirellulaceae bacterium]
MRHGQNRVQEATRTDMPTPSMLTDVERSRAQDLVEVAAAKGYLSEEARAHVIEWLTSPWLAEHHAAVAELIQQGRFPELQDAFWTILPFGTAGRRGRMFPVGTNTLNVRTVGETVQALAVYLVELHGEMQRPSAEG